MAKKRRKRDSKKGNILFISGIFFSIVFSGVAVVSVVGMVPTIVSAIVDRSRGHVRTISIGALNFAGCMPFIIDVFKRNSDISYAVHLVLEPRTIVIAYFAAAMGYMIDWSMTGIVSSIMVQRAKFRIKEIQKRQDELVTRWGTEVTGSIPIDSFGFPVDKFASRENADSED